MLSNRSVFHLDLETKKDLNEKYNITEFRYTAFTNMMHPQWDIVGSLIVRPYPYDGLFKSKPYYRGFSINHPSVFGKCCTHMWYSIQIFFRPPSYCTRHCEKKYPGKAFMITLKIVVKYSLYPTCFIMELKEFISLIVPIFLMGWVSMIAVILPASSGEKIGFVTALELTLVFMMGTLDTYLVSALRGEQRPLIVNALGY